jgi:hypothetical protein
MRDLTFQVSNVKALKTEAGARRRLNDACEPFDVTTFVLALPNGQGFVPVAILGPKTVCYALAFANAGVYCVNGR